MCRLRAQTSWINTFILSDLVDFQSLTLSSRDEMWYGDADILEHKQSLQKSPIKHQYKTNEMNKKVKKIAPISLEKFENSLPRSLSFLSFPNNSFGRQRKTHNLF